MKITKLNLVLSFLFVSFFVSAQTDVSSTVISTDTNWALSGSPYNVIGNVQITANATLTIEAGVEVNFMADRRFEILGAIQINGTESSHVTFKGYSDVGTFGMLFFKNTSLDISKIEYTDFTGPQRAIQLADESGDNPDNVQNSGQLNVNYSTFLNTEAVIKGYYTYSSLVFNNSSFTNSKLRGLYHTYEEVVLNNCNFYGGEIRTYYYNKFKIYDSTIQNAIVYILNYEWDDSEFLISRSKIYDSDFSGSNGKVNFSNSIFVDSPLNFPSNNVTVSGSVISFDGNTINRGLYTRKATISNSLITGRGAGTAIEINDTNNNTSTISNSLITDNAIGVIVSGNNGTFDFQYNNFSKNKELALQNLNYNNINATNNYWGTSIETEVEDLIFHNTDDIFSNYGLVIYSPLASVYNDNSLISPPQNIAKVVSGSDVVLTWTPNEDANVVGYKLHYGDPTGLSYATTVDLGNVSTYTITGGTIDTEYALTAYTIDADGVNDQMEGFESWFGIAKEAKVSLKASEELFTEDVGDITITAAMETVLPYDVTVTLGIAGTATTDVDYTLSSNTLVIPAGQLSAIATISVLTDELVEYDETIVVSIESVTEASEDGEQVVTLTIQNSNPPTITLTTTATTIAENGSYNLIASIDARISEDILIDFELLGDAKFNADYTTDSPVRISTVAGGNGAGSNVNQLGYTNSVHVDGQGLIYAGDRNYGRIKRWIPGAETGEVVLSGLEGHMMDFEIDSEGTIYLMEHGNGRVMKYVSGDTSGVLVAGGNGLGAADNQLYYPRGIFVDKSGNIYIADSDNHRIQKWEPGANVGVTVAGGNGNGSNSNQLWVPWAVYVDDAGNIYIADSSNNRIQKWEPGATEGITVLSQADLGIFYPTDIYVDVNENIYFSDSYNSTIFKYNEKSKELTTVAGGNGNGNGENQLSDPYKFFVNSIGDIYVADYNNSRIQKYEFTPQMVIKSGGTRAELTVSGMLDNIDEVDETIQLKALTTNAIFGSSDVIPVTLTDLNEPPVVSFEFSNDRISENSDTDVTLIASLSEVSAKDVEISFTMEGDAVENEEYTVSSTTISIPANNLEGTLTITTKDLKDTLVEVLENITFRVATITNATTIEETATLLLESDDDPTVSLSTSIETIAENETFNVIATINAPTSKDVIVDFEPLGLAVYNTDYTSDSPVRVNTVAGGNGYGTNANQLALPNSVHVNSEGVIYVGSTDGRYLKKWIPGEEVGEIVLSDIEIKDFDIDSEGAIYVLDQINHQVKKYVPGDTNGVVVAGGNSQGSDNSQLDSPSGMFIDDLGNIYIADRNNHRIQKWAPGAIEGVTVAGGNGSGAASNQLSYPNQVFIDNLGNIYVADSNSRIQKWESGANEGITVINSSMEFQLNPTDIYVDNSQNIYVLNEWESSILKYSEGSNEPIVVAGGNGYGNAMNQLSNPAQFFVDPIGNIYIADSENSRIQKYEFTPQLVIESGATTGELLFLGIEDTRDEEDETIQLNPVATNADLVSTDAISVILTDINEMPVVSFDFSSDRISENSQTDVVLTATVSDVSAKDIDISFTMEGSAVETTDYTISSNTISIPANTSKGTLSISTKDLFDDVVEVLDSIVFKVATITNATAAKETATLLLESDDDPNVTFSTSNESIAENESFTISATLDLPASKDVIVDLASIGTAFYKLDFTSNSPDRISTVAGGNGYGNNANQLSWPNNVFVDSEGVIYVSEQENNRIKKWAPGAETGEVILTGVNVTDFYIDSEGIIYVVDGSNHVVKKYVIGDTTGEIVAGGQGNGSNSNQLNYPISITLDNIGNIYITDRNNHRIQKWTPGAIEGITVAGGTGQGALNSQLSYPGDAFVDANGNIYIADTNNHRIQKWESGANEGITILSSQEMGESFYPNGISVDDFQNIYYSDNYMEPRIYKFNEEVKESVLIAGGNGYGNAMNQLSYGITFFVDPIGNIYIADSDNSRIQKYEFTPQIIIEAGSTNGELSISGIIDNIDEHDETIELTPFATNAIITSTETISVTLTDINEPPGVSFEFSNDRISENSDTDVILTATVSEVSAKDIEISFTMEGSAEETTDYTLSSTTISIPANTSKGTLSISTKDLGDDLPEVLDSIVFRVATITNATAAKETATLLLESDDDPEVTLTTSSESIAEHETFNVIATLDAPVSKDVIIGLNSIGTAVYDVDFTTNTPLRISTVAGGKGQGSANNQLYYPRGVFVDDSGIVYVADFDNSRIVKRTPGVEELEIVIGYVPNPWDVFVDDSGNIYVSEYYQHRVTKWEPGATSGTVVAGGNGSGSNPNQLNYPRGIFVDGNGDIYIADFENSRIQKWASGTEVGVTVAGGNSYGYDSNQIPFPESVILDENGVLYIGNSWNQRIIKWVEGEDSGSVLLNRSNRDISLYNGYLYVVDEGEHKVVKYNLENLQLGYEGMYEQGKVVAGGNGYGSNEDQLYNPQNIYVDNAGTLYVSDLNNHRIQKYDLTPQVVVPAGETQGQLLISGKEDEFNDEGDEYIQFEAAGVQNANLTNTEVLSVTLLDVTKTLTLQNSPFMGLSRGAVSWGDYDRDGDKDVAIMGESLSGAVTILYENQDGTFVNTNQNFAKLYGGDITWVDLNKDGWIDLVVSGFDGTAPQTRVYMNKEGTYFEPTNGYGLPNLFSTKMAWGDLDNDGDIDLAVAGQYASDDYVFDIYYKENDSNSFVKEPLFNREGFIKGDLKIVDIDLDGDNDIIYNGQNSSGNAISGYVLNSYIRTSVNYDNVFRNKFENNWDNFYYKNSAIEIVKIKENNNEYLNIFSQGENSQGEIKLFINEYLSNGMDKPEFPLLKNGDIAIADFNNDGTNDIVFTGENKEGVPITKLFRQNASGYFVDSEITLEGLRESTANWVDYDMDGDLDLFLTGMKSEGGAVTLLYETEIAHKKNAAPEKITGLVAEDLGNGNIRFKWDLPNDDFTTNLGYVIRIGTTSGGTELSNTESDLETGVRLISKTPPIYTNFYDMQLDPGTYYWSVQAVDTGLKGSAFSDEAVFTLAYEWKILNQGGIVDRSIQGVVDPVLKLADIDNDDDLDVIYGSKNSNYYYNTQILKFDGTQLVKDNSHPLNYVSQISSSEVGDVNGDGTTDILINHWIGSAYGLKIYLSNGSGYDEKPIGNGLYNAKAKIADLNNDGQAEIFTVGMSSNSIDGVPKLYVYEYNAGLFDIIDASDQIDQLQYASYDLGDVDNDQDIDFIISGYNAVTGLQSFIYENVTEMGGEFTLQKTSNNLVAVRDGTTDFIDFDGDGDLDAVFTGVSVQGDVFEIYMNMLNEGITEWPKFSNGLSPMREGKIDLGDFNGDGYSDLLYSGIVEGVGDVTKLSEYEPTTETYVESAFDVSDIIKAEVEFGDLDGDGDLDFAIAGKSVEGNENIFRTYINVRNQSAEVLGSKAAAKQPKYVGKKAAIRAAKEIVYTVNESPSVPVPNEVVFLEGVEGSGDIPVEFSWEPSTDDHTPEAGLTYAIKVGTTPGGEEIMASNSNMNGVKKDAEKGNVEHNLKWKLSLPVGTYYWSVQAVDASYSGSSFSSPKQFKVTEAGIDNDADGDGVPNDVDICPGTPKGDNVDANGCSIQALLGDSNGNEVVDVIDLVINVDYILGKDPVPFVFKAADVNNDEVVNVLDIVGTVDIILSATGGKSTLALKPSNYYPNAPIGEAEFYWEGNDLYVSSLEDIAGLQLVFDKGFEFELADGLDKFSSLQFEKDGNSTIMLYSFSDVSLPFGVTKLLTKLDDSQKVLLENKSAVGTPGGFKLEVKLKQNLIDNSNYFTVGPNPSNGYVNVIYTLPELRDSFSFRVYNMQGALVWTSYEALNKTQNKTSINLESLADGVYFIVIEAFENGMLKEKEVEQLIIKK